MIFLRTAGPPLEKMYMILFPKQTGACSQCITSCQGKKSEWKK